MAKESGEALEEIIGEPGFDHAELGDLMPLFTGVLFLVALILWLVQRSYAKKDDGGKAGIIIVGLIAAAVAAFNLYWVFQVGHSGAESVWKGEIAAATAPAAAATPEPTAPPTTSASPSASPSKDGTYTAAEVATHNTAGDCWTSINGNVYDLTDWEDKHPGGAERIIALCGTDGSSAFDDQHSGEPEPEDMLAEYKIGVLAQ
ncbi:MAG TPA: cytochrome b5-like heme/steroid binding domain-containing protein [Actinomycetota bacterium]|nr:cytochrome b5-like heme/steroid binding domain-containing protein [Actinomycetota bacterium]